MPTYFLRLEGVNLANVIDDTDDLSTRRGGGLMVLEAAVRLIDRLPVEFRDRLSPVATSASIGLFRFEACDEGDAELVRSVVERSLRERGNSASGANPGDDLPLHHGTFVVDFTPDTGDTKADVERATALNRWRQMGEPSLALHDIWLPSGTPPAAAPTFCARDRIRPATRDLRTPENVVERVSTSVYERRAFGRQARQRFYRREVNRDLPFDFTNDLLSLSQLTAKGESDDVWKSVPANTDGKIAVFYVDGNRFGELARQGLKRGAEAYRRWSEALRKHHRQLLDALLRRIQEDATWRFADEANQTDRARLETLLWGGDEILWVVPAWKGWELVEWFFGQSHVVEGETLSYGGGLVFSHANAPIKNITQLAHSLADLAKASGKDAGKAAVNDTDKNVAKDAGPRRAEHRVAYEVLESFDDITGDLGAHRQRWLPKESSPELLLLNPERLAARHELGSAAMSGWELLHQLAANRELPTRQLYQLCQAWRRGDEWAPNRARIASAVGGKSCDAVEAAFGSVAGTADAPAAWLHVLQMLPYLPTAAGANRT